MPVKEFDLFRLQIGPFSGNLLVPVSSSSFELRVKFFPILYDGWCG